MPLTREQKSRLIAAYEPVLYLHPDEAGQAVFTHPDRFADIRVFVTEEDAVRREWRLFWLCSAFFWIPFFGMMAMALLWWSAATR